MKLLWTLFKVVLVLALAIPVGIIVLTMALGILGTLFGLSVAVLKLAVIGFVVWGAFKLAASLFGGPAPQPVRPEVRELPRVDPHYAATMRELDQELGEASR